MYILGCADGSYYVGSTKDLKTRLIQHQNGTGSMYTSNRLPVTLLYYEEYENVAEAFKREKQMQGWGRRKREALICGKQELLPLLAKKVFHRSTIDSEMVDHDN